MSARNPYGMFPTAYGVSVPVFKPSSDASSDPDHFLFDMEGTAVMAGIHDAAERCRFVADARRLSGCPRFENYGGHNVPHSPLPRPKEPAYPKVAGMEADIPVEAWTTGILNCSRWIDRADFLLDIIGDNQVLATAWVNDTLMAEVSALGLSIVMTAALEHLCETEIDCLEAAAMYALTEHDEWRQAG
ncbi:hypothetical protein, partial [Methylobacterium sp. J-067]|uniref:hypothetical protein n=1 Tax=Methylobacterium sp. J-067 TaxID=2836648 RepID=UPI001FBB683F